MRKQLSRITITCAVLTVGGSAPLALFAQTVSACYVPQVGALYVIKRSGLPQACLSSTHTEVTLGAPTSLAWNLTGNAGIEATHFFGSTDNQPLRFRVNNTEVMRIRAAGIPGTNIITGAIGIGTVLNAQAPLHIELNEGAFRVHPYFMPSSSGTVLLGEWTGTNGGAQVRYEGPTAGFADVGLNGTGDYVIEDEDRPRLIVKRQGNGAATLINDNEGGPLTSTTPNEFAVRASGGVRLRTSTDLSTGCNLAGGSGSWACTSSRAAKWNFAPVDAEKILAAIASLPIQRWSYRGQGTTTAHIGPFAEDFHKAFGVGEGPTTISSVDADGVSLLGIKALEARTRQLERENADLRSRLSALEALVRQNLTLPSPRR